MLALSKGIQLASRFTLDRRLGGDSKAEVWLAKDRFTNTLVALKIVDGNGANAAHLRAEWKTSIRLMHAHIVRVFEFHADKELAFFSQQYVDGPNLSAVSGQSPEAVLAPIGLITDALRYIHAKNIVHRDLKAANVLLDHNGSPYLSDFGVAGRTGELATGGSLIAQSPQSLAGEVAHPKDDIFALGGMMFELIAGRSPWSPTDIAEEIKSKKVAPLVAADGSPVPSLLRDLVASMLDKDAAIRPDAEQVNMALQQAGFAGGPARTARVPQRPDSRDEVIESVSSTRNRSVPQEALPAAQERTGGGVSRTIIGVALIVSLALLVGVVFILPDRVEKNAADRVIIDAAASAAARKDSGAGRDEDTDPNKRRNRGEVDLPTRTLDDEKITFNENLADYSGLDEEGRQRYAAEAALGELLSALEILEGRAVERWAAVEHRDARALYAEGDQAYLDKEFKAAEGMYLDALDVIDPLYDRIEPTFQKAFAEAQAAFDAGDRATSLEQFELAVAITPTHAGALAGLERARNLETVLRLMEQGVEFEEDLELIAAQRSFEQVAELDPLWEPAQEALLRVEQARIKMEFDQRMTEAFDALSTGDYLAARAAFRMAERLIPESQEPRDGLLQVDQGMRLDNIRVLEREAAALERDEHWDAVAETYEGILKVDSTLSFAIEGLNNARQMSTLHKNLDDFISEPDKLSVPSTMQRATTLLVNITTRPEVGPRLAMQRDELSRLLKRAATPLSVALVSDNVTDVSIYKIGRLGNFMKTEIDLRPGTYVAVGVRAGYRDVRMEFRVAPEIEMEAVIVRCEEPI